MKRETFPAQKPFETFSAQQTKKFAFDFAKQIAKASPQKGAAVIALKGELGAGKTTFVQGFAKGFCIKEKILSPTFLIIKKFHVSGLPRTEPKALVRGFTFHDFYHIDCYRLKSPKELLQLEWKEIIQNPNNIVAVEWADKVYSLIPKDALWVSLSHNGKGKRSISVGIDRLYPKIERSPLDLRLNQKTSRIKDA